MALNISTTLKTTDGFSLENSYGRVGVSNDVDGNMVVARVLIYASAEAFDNGDKPVRIAGLELTEVKAYDYAKDKKNILDLAHDMMITKLADQEVIATKNLG
jgi:hypothetical protein